MIAQDTQQGNVEGEDHGECAEGQCKTAHQQQNDGRQQGRLEEDADQAQRDAGLHACVIERIDDRGGESYKGVSILGKEGKNRLPQLVPWTKCLNASVSC